MINIWDIGKSYPSNPKVGVILAEYKGNWMASFYFNEKEIEYRLLDIVDDISHTK